MRVLTSGLAIEEFKTRVARAPARVLMLDYDGTLAPFHVRPELAVPYPEASAVLRDIARAGGTRIVVVSGRPADEVPPLLGLTPTPEIWGAHGRERLLPDGRREVQKPEAQVQGLLEEAAHAVTGLRGTRVERKLASVALHWRGAPDDAAAHAKERALERWEPLTRRGALEMLPFEAGMEIRASGHNKANAVAAVLAETDEDSAVAYLGDDVTDEDAFRAVQPRGLAVLVRPELRKTAADVWLEPPHELASFLQMWAIKN